MPNTTTPGHITITVGSAKTKLLVDPVSYGMVDIVDFAPRAVSGTPTFSTLGLYLDVAQNGFGHGYGQWEYGEPQSYAYTGQLIDTRHDHIQLFTNYSTVLGATASMVIYDLAKYGGCIVFTDEQGISVLKPSNSARVKYSLAAAGRKILQTGKYLFVSYSGRMQIVYIAKPSSTTSTSATFSTAAFEATNQWQNGKVVVVDGTGATSTAVTITSSTSTVINVSSWASGTPNTSSYLMLVANAGASGNPPNNFDKMAVFGGYMWGYESGTNYLHFWSETNGADAEGGGTADLAVIKVGPVGRPLVNLLPFLNQLYAFRSDGAWTLNEQDTDGLAYHTLPYDTEASTSNFATTMIWQGFLVYSVRNRLFKYKSGIQDITPPNWNDDHPPKTFGNFKGLCARGRFLYMLGQSNAANSDETTETTTGFTSLLATDGVGWHKLIDLPVTTPTQFGAWIDADGDAMYLHAYSGTDGYLWKVQLQTYSDLAYASYATSGTYNFYSPYYDLGMRRIPKSFATLVLHGEFPTGTQVAAAYRVDTATGWTALGTAFTSDMQEVSFPSTLTGKRIQFRLTLSTTTAANTPIIKAIIIKVMMRPTVKYGVTCDVLISDNLSDQNRQLVGHTASEIKAALMSARDSVTPITFVDIYGTSYSAYLASLRFEVLAYEDSDAVQSVAKCTFVFV